MKKLVNHVNFFAYMMILVKYNDPVKIHSMVHALRCYFKIQILIFGLGGISSPSKMYLAALEVLPDPHCSRLLRYQWEASIQE
jgi:hypothetical protein